MVGRKPSIGGKINLRLRSRVIGGSAAFGIATIFLAASMSSGLSGMMALPGKFSVSPSGAAGYGIPIAIPPGSAGVMPSLSLDYNSQMKNGLLGMSWTLGGLPSIGRCPKTMAQDGAPGNVNLDANDRFCMEGQRLIVTSGTYGADGALYRTEVDTLSKIISHGTAGNGPAWFEVHAKSGQIMEFGHTADSQILAQGKTTARGWALNKLSDTKTNYFTVTYTNDATNGQTYPSRIDYTGNTTAAVSPYNSVQFTYATRPDINPTYQAGSLSQITVRLTDIKTYTGTTVISDYKLAYQQSPSSNVSEIVSVTACDAAASCLPATKFQWANGGGSSFSGVAAAVPNGENFGTPMVVGASATQGGVGYMQIFSDFNRDGKSDFLMLNGANLYGFLSNGDGTYTAKNSVAPNGWNFGTSPSSSFTLIPGDFDGDGETEFAMLGGAYLYVFLSNGDGTFSGVTFPCPNGWNFGTPPGSAFTAVAGDFNSDGRTDFLMINGANMYEFLSNGDGTFTGNTITISNGWNFGSPPSANFTPITGDFNGDGKTDFILMGGGNLYEFMGNGDGTFTYTTIAISTGWNFGSPPISGFMPIVGDFNGDGKTDWVMLQGGILYEFQSRGDGTFNYLTIPTGSWNFGSPASAAYVPIAGDFNADGKADFALIGGNSANIYQFLSNGDGTFTFNTIAMPNSWNFGSPPTASYYLSAGDFNGDGKADFALMSAATIYTVTTNGSYGDMMVAITGGLGVTTSITYAPLTSSTVYNKDPAVNYPQQNLQSPLYVVSRVDNSNGVGGTYSSTYSYAGAKVDLTGRGFLGFRQMAVKDLQTNISDTTTFRQDFPFIGLVATTTRSYGSQALGQSVNTYQFANAGGTTTISPSGAPYQVSLSQNVSSGTDLDGSALPTVTTANTYDAFGNATKVTVSTPDGFAKTTTNTFTNDTTNWYLGRLTRATVISTAP
jgi:Insecticide toxin TcdB middle/N-terminal region/Salmonella virulence plasmid 65kDa B protein/FG-GAP-like repeat